MAKSGIKIKPSKRGTFTAAAKSRGKTVQRFASQVMRSPDSYSPAMVKKANFARNAAKWKKELGGFLDQQLNETPIDQTLVNTGLVEFGYGGKLKSHKNGGKLAYIKKEAKDLKKGGVGQLFEEIREGESEDIMAFRHLGIMPKLPGVHLKRYLEYGGKIPQAQLDSGIEHEMEHTSSKTVAKKTAMDHFKEHGPNYYKVLNKAIKDSLPTYQGGGYLDLSTPEKKKFNAAAKAMGHTRKQHAAHIFANGGQIQGGGDVTFNPPVTISLKSGQIGEGGTTEGLGEGIGGAFSSAFDNLTDLASPDVPTEGGLPGIGQLTSQNPGLPEFIPDTLPFQNGGNLPQFASGGWMEPEEAFGLVGDVASAIPVIGTIAGPIIKTVGKVIGKKQAADKLEHDQDVQARTLDFNSRKRAEAIEEQRTLSQFQFGGGLTSEGGNMRNPVINEYNGNSNTHQQGVGGVPVDAKGNPSTVSKQSAVGLTEKGEVTWNGYVFSDKLT